VILENWRGTKPTVDTEYPTLKEIRTIDLVEMERGAE
jgi:hypothetical protein